MGVEIKYKLSPVEKVLPDHYSILYGYLYIVDEIVVRSPATGTVGEWKKKGGVREVRQCDLDEHKGVQVGDKVS